MRIEFYSSDFHEVPDLNHVSQATSAYQAAAQRERQAHVLAQEGTCECWWIEYRIIQAVFLRGCHLQIDSGCATPTMYVDGESLVVPTCLNNLLILTCTVSKQLSYIMCFWYLLYPHVLTDHTDYIHTLPRIFDHTRRRHMSKLAKQKTERGISIAEDQHGMHDVVHLFLHMISMPLNEYFVGGPMSTSFPIPIMGSLVTLRFPLHLLTVPGRNHRT